MPVKTVFICEQRFGGSSKDIVTGARLMNAIGRAGRSAMDTEGIVVLATHSHPERAFRELEPTPDELESKSTLATDSALLDVATYLDKARAEEDWSIALAGEAVQGFLSFVWFVASNEERAERQIDEVHLEELLGSTLAWSQLDEPERRLWLSLALNCLESYYQTPRESRLRWGQTGTSLTSAQSLEEVLQEVLAGLSSRGDSQSPREQILWLLDNGRLQKLLDLKEAPEIVIGSLRRRERIQADRAAPILSDWLNGLDFLSIADNRFSEFEDAEQRAEYLTEVLAKWFETYLPWVLGTLVSWVNEHSSVGELGLDSDLPLYVRWGVPTDSGLELLKGGINSRRLALAIDAHWNESSNKGTVLDWLSSLPVSALKDLLTPSDTELGDLLNVCRTGNERVGGKLLEGEEVSLELGFQSRHFEPVRVTVGFVGGEAMAPIAIFTDRAMVREVPSWLYLDFARILAEGSAITGWIEADNSMLKLRCRVEERV